MRCGNRLYRIPYKQTYRTKLLAAIPGRKKTCRGDGAEQAARSSTRLHSLNAVSCTICVGLPPGARQTGPADVCMCGVAVVLAPAA